MTQNKLESCPFCGAEPKTNVRYWKCGGPELKLFAEIVCECGITKSVEFQGNEVSFDTYLNAFNKVTEIWNRRSKCGA